MFFLLSCADHTHKFEEVAPGLQLKLQALGEKERPVSGFPFVELFVYTQPLDSTLDLERGKYFFQQVAPDYLGSEELGNQLFLLNEGDSASFILEYRHLKGGLLDKYQQLSYSDDRKLLMHVKVGRLRSEAEYEKELEKEMREGAVRENAYLREWLEKKGLLENVIQVGDVYYFKTVEKEGSLLETGDHLTLHYTGYFLDGTEFDSSEKGTSALYFQLGKPDQVIPGIDSVLFQMRDREQARIFIPSHQAFGLAGSTTGIVPEKTPVYFDIEILDVEKDTLEVQSTVQY